MEVERTTHGPSRSTPAARAATTTWFPCWTWASRPIPACFPRTREQAVPVRPAEPGQVHRQASACGLLAAAALVRSGRHVRRRLRLSVGPERIDGPAPAGQGEADPVDRGCARRGIVLDIGSNDGTTLAAYPSGKFRHHRHRSDRAPSFASTTRPDVQIVPDFFSARQLPEGVRRREGLGRSRRSRCSTTSSTRWSSCGRCTRCWPTSGVWMFEQSYLPLMLRAQLVRHRLPRTRRVLLARARSTGWPPAPGFKIIDIEFNDVNGGSSSVTAAKAGQRLPGVAAAGGRAGARAGHGPGRAGPVRRVRRAGGQQPRAAARRSSQQAQAEGKTVAALGASTKGNVLLQYCGLTPRRDRGQWAR